MVAPQMGSGGDEKPVSKAAGGDDFAARLSRAEAERHREKVGTAADANKTAKGIGLRVGVDLAAGVLVGVLIGLAIDRWFGTAPWGLLILFFLGTAAGFLNVYRALQGFGYDVGYRRGGPGQGSGGAGDATRGSGQPERDAGSTGDRTEGS